MGVVEGALLLLAAQQPNRQWLGGPRPDLVLTRDTVVFAAPSVVAERQLAQKTGLDDLYRLVEPRLGELGLKVLRSDQTSIGWQDPTDGERRGEIRLSPMGDFIGIILISPGKRPPGRPANPREQPETCKAFVTRVESYYERRFRAPDPCGAPHPKASGDAHRDPP